MQQNPLHVLPDAFNELEQWNDIFLIDTPPALLFASSGTANNESLFVTWTFPPVVDTGFADINLPHHETVIVQYVKTSLNGAGDFTDGSTVTVDTGSKTTNEIKIFIDSARNYISLFIPSKTSTGNI